MNGRRRPFLGVVIGLVALWGNLARTATSGGNYLFPWRPGFIAIRGINVSQPTAPFSAVPNLSALDYASPVRRNNVDIRIAAGTPRENSGGVEKLVDGLWPWDGDRDAPSQVLFF